MDVLLLALALTAEKILYFVALAQNKDCNEWQDKATKK
jgi:hypothetical protein